MWSGKDHAFFFLAYQGIRNPSNTLGQSSSLGILPSEFGRLQSTFPGNAVINTIATTAKTFPTTSSTGTSPC